MKLQVLFPDDFLNGQQVLLAERFEEQVDPAKMLMSAAWTREALIFNLHRSRRKRGVALLADAVGVTLCGNPSRVEKERTSPQSYCFWETKKTKWHHATASDRSCCTMNRCCKREAVVGDFSSRWFSAWFSRGDTRRSRVSPAHHALCVPGTLLQRCSVDFLKLVNQLRGTRRRKLSRYSQSVMYILHLRLEPEWTWG